MLYSECFWDRIQRCDEAWQEDDDQTGGDGYLYQFKNNSKYPVEHLPILP